MPASPTDCREEPRLILVAAPAGFGKTTLLAQWVEAAERSQRRVAWLALDQATPTSGVPDRCRGGDPDRGPEAGVDAPALLEAGATTPPDAVLVSLINDLDLLAGPMVVALDDYHVIDAAAVHEAVTFLLENLPPQVTLAITTAPTRRSAVSPACARRARGGRAADLRFTTDEAEVFLKR